MVREQRLWSKKRRAGATLQLGVEISRLLAPMGCIYHPDYDATEICDQCGVDLCSSCAIHMEDRRTLCHRCMLALSLQDVKSETTRLKQAKQSQRLGLDKGWRPTYLQVLFMVGGVLASLFVGLYFYWGQPVQRPQVVLDSSRPMGLLTELQYALTRYGAAHQDRYPDSLYDLLPDFLTDTERNRKVLHNMVYGLDAREGYVLRIKENAPFPGKELEATTKGIRVVGEK